MKRYLILLLLLIGIFSSQNIHAQHGDDKVKAIKVSLITDKMQLSAAQAAQFWPVYNRYESELKVVWHSKKNLTKEKGKTAEEIIDERQKLEERELLIKSKYKTEFLKIVSANQLNQMYIAEAEFREMLLKRMKN